MNADTIRAVGEVLRGGAEFVRAVLAFAQWFKADPEDAALTAMVRARETAAGKAAHDAARNAGPRRGR